ncbi:MAG: hypothetical protein VXU46_04350 [Planctomycetota bacterium]|nr:hypothetical protein [Planctomycetota bacterium]
MSIHLDRQFLGHGLPRCVAGRSCDRWEYRLGCSTAADCRKEHNVDCGYRPCLKYGYFVIARTESRTLFAASCGDCLDAGYRKLLNYDGDRTGLDSKRDIQMAAQLRSNLGGTMPCRVRNFAKLHAEQVPALLAGRGDSNKFSRSLGRNRGRLFGGMLNR